MYIYLIVNHVTGKYYVGQHKGNNLERYFQKKFSLARHAKGSSHLFNSMRKHPLPCDWSIHALLSDIQTRSELDQHEKDFISFLRSQDPEYGYNICRGGEGFTGKHTEEWKKNHSAMMKGRVFSPETVAKMKAAPKSEIQLNNLKRARDSDVIAKRTERYATDPSYRLKISEASKRQWADANPVRRAEMEKGLTVIREKRWAKYREGKVGEKRTAQIVDLHKKGLSQRAIARELGIGKSTVHSHLSLWYTETLTGEFK